MFGLPFFNRKRQRIQQAFRRLGDTAVETPRHEKDGEQEKHHDRSEPGPGVPKGNTRDARG